MKSCRTVSSYLRFGGDCRLIFQGVTSRFSWIMWTLTMEVMRTSKMCVALCQSPRYRIAQAWVFSKAALKASNLASYVYCFAEYICFNRKKEKKKAVRKESQRCCCRVFKRSVVDLGNNVPCTSSNAFSILKLSEIKC